MTKQPYWFMATAIAIAAVIGAVTATIKHQEVQQQAQVPIAASPSPVPSPLDLSNSPLPSPSAQEPTASSPSPTPSQATPEPTPERLTGNSKVTINGMGPVRVGMTVDQASQAAGTPLISAGDSGSPGCEYYQTKDNPEKVAFMVTDGRIARVDVLQGSQVTTRSGVGLGATEDQVKALFPGQIEVMPHEYVQGGHYLVFTPKDAGDSNYRIVFETDATGNVTMIRAGKLPEVMWIEGCA
jgi:hypothetical protein